MKIFVKNMACESCKVVIKEALHEMDIVAVTIDFGEIETKEELTDDQKTELNRKLRLIGMELIEKKKGILIEKIKLTIIDYIANKEASTAVKFSVFLSDELHHNYTYLANCFSEVEATTIEQYIIRLKIEQIKQFIMYDELTFSEIAYKLNYSSAAHLSGQFKKNTGLTPSHYRALKEKRRICIQNI